MCGQDQITCYLRSARVLYSDLTLLWQYMLKPDVEAMWYYSIRMIIAIWRHSQRNESWEREDGSLTESFGRETITDQQMICSIKFEFGLVDSSGDLPTSSSLQDFESASSLSGIAVSVTSFWEQFWNWCEFENLAWTEFKVYLCTDRSCNSKEPAVL